MDIKEIYFNSYNDQLLTPIARATMQAIRKVSGRQIYQNARVMMLGDNTIYRITRVNQDMTLLLSSRQENKKIDGVLFVNVFRVDLFETELKRTLKNER